MMIDSSEKITSLIPQAPPFVMIDQLVYSDEKVSRSNLTVREDNIFVENGHFLEAGMVENIAQTAAARVGYIAKEHNVPVPVGYIGAIKNLEVFSLPAVNDLLDTEISIENQIFDVTVITGRVKCREQLLAQCEMKIFISQNK